MNPKLFEFNNSILKICKISSFLSVSPLMASIRQTDELISLNEEKILMNQTMVKAFRVPYEPRYLIAQQVCIIF
jgi:hypothetical protein